MTDPKMHFAFAFVTSLTGLIMLGTVWLNFLAQGRKRQFRYIRLPLLFWGILFLAFLLAGRFPEAEGPLFAVAFIAGVAFLTAAMHTNAALQPRPEPKKEPDEGKPGTEAV